MNKKVVVLLLLTIGILLFLGLTTLMTWMDLHYYVSLNEGVYQKVWMEKASFFLLAFGLGAFIFLVLILIAIVLGAKMWWEKQ